MGKTFGLKNYYVPGSFSLIFLWLVFIHFAEKKCRYHSRTAISVMMYNPDLMKRMLASLDSLFPQRPRSEYEFPPKREYVDIVLNGDEYADRVKLDYAQVKVREIISSTDTSTGVHFKFSDNANFGSFVKAVDVLQGEKAKRYAIEDRDIWFFEFPPENFVSDNYTFICGTGSNYTLLDPPARWDEYSKQLSEIWRTSWGIIFSLSAFLATVFTFRIFSISPSTSKSPPQSPYPAGA